MKEDDMKIIAEAIDICISDPNGDHSKALELVKGLTDKYPLYSK
jgi:glycine hydroxymethyltransferase